MAASRWRRVSRFSLGGLLFLTLCTCVYLGSHRVGERAGVQQAYDESHFVKTYNIDDLLIEAETPAQRDGVFAATAARIRATVSPESWTQPLEPRCELVEAPSMGCLVISQYGVAHDQVLQVLKEIRRERLQASTELALDEIAKLEQSPAREPAVLVSYSLSKSAQARNAITNRYAYLTEELTARWGVPVFAGECTDEGFPAWSAAQSLAAWSRGGDELYLAIQSSPGVGQAVVAGWHAND